MLRVAEKWKTCHPGAMTGTLVMDKISNASEHPEIKRRKKRLEQRLTGCYASTRLAGLRPRSLSGQPGDDFGYDRLTLSLLYLLRKDKPLFHLTALKEAVLLAELENRIMTTAHDLRHIRGDVCLDTAGQDEAYHLMKRNLKKLETGEMVLRDTQGVIFSPLYGPDDRTRITCETRKVFFAVFAPPGASLLTVYRHLEDIQASVRMISPRAETEALNVYCGEEQEGAVQRC